MLRNFLSEVPPEYEEMFRDKLIVYAAQLSQDYKARYREAMYQALLA